MENSQTKKTPLYEGHLALKAKMVEFAGWLMPVQYQGVTEEHLNCRKNVGLFDVSHMCEIRISGPKSLETLEWLTTNAVGKLAAGQAHYSLLPNDRGGLVDDIIIYCIEPRANYLVCVNASNKDKDFAWMLANNRGADIVDESSSWVQIAVQGPKAISLINKVLKVNSPKAFEHLSFQFRNAKGLLAMTGYTGETGGEIFVESARGLELWNTLLEQGKEFNVGAVGLAARDTLRTEMKYSLYGHEIDDTSNPYEAGLGWVIKAKDKDFLGKSLIMEGQKSPKRRLIGFRMKDRGIPRQGYRILDNAGTAMGAVTSGTHSPSLDEPIGIGYVAVSHSSPGSAIAVEIRGRSVAAVVCETPFVKH